eukprot:scaffold13314_cov63-Phaeocystis_antarctica.AAC.2
MTFSVQCCNKKGRNFAFAGKATHIEECLAPPSPPALPAPTPSPPPIPPCRGLDRPDALTGSTYDYPEGYLQMDFTKTSLKINNLGGFCAPPEPPDGCNYITGEGYNLSEPVLLYTNIGKLRKVGDPPGAPLAQVNLKVEVAPGSKYNANNGGRVNGFGKTDSFGEINLGGRREDMTTGDLNEATFIFTLLDHSTKLPIEGLIFFALSYFDFDHQNNQYGGRECLTLQEPAPSNYAFQMGSNIQPYGSAVPSSTSSDAPKFCSNITGTNVDNPTNPSDIGVGIIGEDGQTTYVGGNEEVKRTAVTFQFREINVMKVTYSVACCINTGRNFLFAGATAPLTPCGTPPPAPSAPPPSPLLSAPSPPSPSPPPPYAFTDTASLKTAVQAYNDDPTAAIATYGPISGWDVSAVTSMSQLFKDLDVFNADISGWDTSGVTDMSEMFR